MSDTTTTAPATGNTSAPASTTPPATAGGTPGAAQDPKTTSTAMTAGDTTTTTEPKKDGQGEGEPKGTTTPPPAEIQIKLPDGVKLDEGLLNSFKPIAQKLGLKSEGAQELVDLFVATQQKAAQVQQETHLDTITKWAEEAKADKEIGNTNWDTTVKQGQLALRKLGNPELVQLLNETGLGNHKAVIKFFATVGKSLSEDSLNGTTSTPGPTDSVPLEVALYPSMQKK